MNIYCLCYFWIYFKPPVNQNATKKIEVYYFSLESGFLAALILKNTFFGWLCACHTSKVICFTIIFYSFHKPLTFSVLMIPINCMFWFTSFYFLKCGIHVLPCWRDQDIYSVFFTVSSSQSSTVFREKILGNFKRCVAWSYEGRKMSFFFCL